MLPVGEEVRRQREDDLCQAWALLPVMPRMTAGLCVTRRKVHRHGTTRGGRHDSWAGGTWAAEVCTPADVDRLQ